MWHSALRAIGAVMLLQALQLPAPTGYINDFAHVIPEASRARMQRVIDDVRTRSGGEIVVVTLADIGDAAPSDVTLRIGREWKVGKAGKPGDVARNTGVIILLVPKETNASGRGQCFIGTGSGSEGFITDAISGDICRGATPFFRQQDYGQGIEAVTFDVAQRYASEYGFTLDTSLVAPSAPAGRGGGSPQMRIPIPVLILLLILFFVIVGSLSRSRSGCGGCLPIFIPMGGGRGGWGGGGFGGGGFGGGGGGGFGGFGGGGGFSGGGGGSSW